MKSLCSYPEENLTKPFLVSANQFQQLGKHFSSGNLKKVKSCSIKMKNKDAIRYTKCFRDSKMQFLQLFPNISNDHTPNILKATFPSFSYLQPCLVRLPRVLALLTKNIFCLNPQGDPGSVDPEKLWHLFLFFEINRDQQSFSRSTTSSNQTIPLHGVGGPVLHNQPLWSKKEIECEQPIYIRLGMKL